MRTLRPEWLVLSALLSAGIAFTAAGPAASTVQGDPAAKAEIAAALQRLNTLPSYRMKATSNKDGTTAVYEIVHPDRSHVTVRSSQYTYEVFTVGKQSASRMAAPGQPSGWQCAPLSSPARGLFGNIENVKKDLDDTTVVRKPDTVIDGTPVHSYVEPSGKGVFYVGVQTGLPRRIVDHDKEGGGTMGFYDYGAKIAIVLPPCR